MLKHWLITVLLLPDLSASAATLEPVDPGLAPDLFVWTDTCNTFVLRDGDAALLIDLGDGGVLDQLEAIGVRRVEWVLFTHHHREQCQGVARLAGMGARLAGPEAERAVRAADGLSQARRSAGAMPSPFMGSSQCSTAHPVHPARPHLRYE